jgi:hypothetical protein
MKVVTQLIGLHIGSAICTLENLGEISLTRVKVQSVSYLGVTGTSVELIVFASLLLKTLFYSYNVASLYVLVGSIVANLH